MKSGSILKPRYIRFRVILDLVISGLQCICIQLTRQKLNICQDNTISKNRFDKVKSYSNERNLCLDYILYFEKNIHVWTLAHYILKYCRTNALANNIISTCTLAVFLLCLFSAFGDTI